MIRAISPARRSSLFSPPLGPWWVSGHLRFHRGDTLSPEFRPPLQANPRPQRPDSGRADSRRAAHLGQVIRPVPRNPLGQFLPRGRRAKNPVRWRRCRRCSAAPPRCRCRRLRCARSWIRIAHPPSTRAATSRAISSACWSFWACSGPFWGLLQTIGSIGDTIQSLDSAPATRARSWDSPSSWACRRPLAGMGPGLFSSLFGLAGSLVLGFLDLQAGRAQNRFTPKLENWLSTVTDLNSEIHADAARAALDGGDQGAGRKVALDAGIGRQLGPIRRVASAMASPGGGHFRAGQDHALRNSS